VDHHPGVYDDPNETSSSTEAVALSTVVLMTLLGAPHGFLEVKPQARSDRRPIAG
jgi:hypothetical protein